jgi:hypothetical protein
MKPHAKQYPPHSCHTEVQIVLNLKIIENSTRMDFISPNQRGLHLQTSSGEKSNGTESDLISRPKN